MNTFATDLRQAIEDNVRSFTLSSHDRAYYFMRLDQKNFDTIMVGDFYRPKNSPDIEPVLSEMKPYGVIVNDKFYTFQSNAYIYEIDSAELDAENEAFFAPTLEGVFKELLADLTVKILRHLSTLTEATVPVPQKDKDEAIEYANVSEAVATGVRPTYSMPSIEYSLVPSGDKKPAAIAYLLGGEEYAEAKYAEILESERGSDIYRTYFSYLVHDRLFDERMGKLSPTEIVVQNMNAALETAKESGAKTVRIFVAGKDENLYTYRLKDFPDFSIEGKEVEAKVDPCFKFKLDGLSSYQFAIVAPVLKEKYGNRRLDFLDKIKPLDVLRIVYGKKVLYERQAS